MKYLKNLLYSLRLIVLIYIIQYLIVFLCTAIYSSLGCDNLTKITMKPINPPTLANSSAIPDNDTLIIEVPSASLEAYKTATNWSNFADKMVGI